MYVDIVFFFKLKFKQVFEWLNVFLWQYMKWRPDSKLLQGLQSKIMAESNPPPSSSRSSTDASSDLGTADSSRWRFNFWLLYLLQEIVKGRFFFCFAFVFEWESWSSERWIWYDRKVVGVYRNERIWVLPFNNFLAPHSLPIWSCYLFLAMMTEGGW